ncbi:MAG: YceI family protein, partial [Microthrixaceae bacterium]
MRIGAVDAGPGPDTGGEVQRISRFLKSPIAIVTGVVVVAVAATAWAMRDQWTWLVEDGSPQTVGAVAPALSDVDESVERLYRIASNDESSVTYSVQETLAGRSQTAEGTTTAVAGDIAINTEDPSVSRVGEIVVNVELFESDSALRDKRIRTDFLDSSEFPMATFDATEVLGIPDALESTTTSKIEITGDLTVRDVTVPATFSGTATLTQDELTAELTTTVLMSDFEVGPINLIGLVSTSDEVELAFDLVAERTDPDEPTPAGAVLVVPRAQIPEGEFAESVQPVIEARCASCHTGDGAGVHTIELATAGDVAEIADEIALVTSQGYMPPWPASAVGLEMKHDFSMPEGEAKVLADWAAAGGGLDVPEDTPIEGENLIYDPIESDFVSIPDEPYTGSLDRPDDYRCVISEVPDPEGDGTWIRGYSFEPDQTEIVHHSIITAVGAAGRAKIQELDDAEEGSGFTCYGQVAGLGVPSQGIGGWTPGRQPTTLPE